MRGLGRAAGKRGAAAGRPMDLRLPATEAPALPAITESERIGDAYAVIGLDARRQVVDPLPAGAGSAGGGDQRGARRSGRPGPVRIGGLVVTRQHPMTAKGTVFLALEDETGMVNVTLWPSTWARLRGVVRRHALLLVDGELQREGEVVNLIARQVRPLPEVAADGRRPGATGRRPSARPCRHAPARVSATSGGRSPSRAAAAAAVRAALGLGRLTTAVRVRELEEPAIPGRGRGEDRADDR